MGLSILGICFLLLMLAISMFVIYRYKINLMRKFITAFVKMVVLVAVVGLLLKYIFILNNAVVSFFSVVLLAVVSAYYAIKKSRLKVSKFVIPVSAGMFFSAFILGLLFLLLIVKTKTPFDAQYFIPIIGLLIAYMAVVIGKALSTYYMGLEHHNALYYYLIGNGATHGEAVCYFLKRALEKTFNAGIVGMTLAGGLVPVLMWSMLVAGANIVTAIIYQISIVIIMICGSVLSILFIIWSSHKFSSDKYDELKGIS